MILKSSRFHFVGIGGIGMCGLAELLKNMGAFVTGSDLQENSNTERLMQMGVKIFIGHRSENIGDSDVIVYSSAVSFSNPELIAGKQKKIPLIPRAEALAEVMRLRRGIAVAGTHGKTTTTSMIAAILLNAQKDPTIVVGGRLDLIKSTALLGQGEWLIAEADESDGSFKKLNPEISVITNIDNDHLDHYKNFENLKSAFWEFGNKVPFYGKLIACGDDLHVRQLFSQYHKKISFYGFGSENDFVIKQFQVGGYECFQQNVPLGKFQIPLGGKHNALNAAAAIIAGMSCGLTFKQCAEGLASFRGVDRRMQFKGDFKGMQIFDDYGHHPTEIKATLEGVKEKHPKAKVLVLFQPHRFSRTQFCWEDFLTCFTDAHKVFITDIYAAGEKPIDGVSGELLAQQCKHPRCHFVPKNKLSEEIKKMTQSETDIIITLGAGDIWKVGEALVNESKN